MRSTLADTQRGFPGRSQKAVTLPIPARPKAYRMFTNPKSLAVLTCSSAWFLQGCSILAALGPTPTPTPTATHTTSPTPSQTLTVTPSPSPSPTETKTPPPLPRITKKRLPDKATLVTDNEIGYRHTIPAGWIIVDVEPEELGEGILSGYQKIAASEAPSSDEVNDFTSAFRFMAMDLSPEHMSEGFPTHIFVMVEESLAEDVPVEFLVEWRVTFLKKDPEKHYLGHRVIHGIDDHSAGWIDNQMMFPTLYGEEVQSHLVIILIPGESYTLSIFLGCEKSLYPELKSLFETILFSLEFEN